MDGPAWGSVDVECDSVDGGGVMVSSRQWLGIEGVTERRVAVCAASTSAVSDVIEGCRGCVDWAEEREIRWQANTYHIC